MKKLANTLLLISVASAFLFSSCTPAPKEEPAPDLDQIKSELQAMEDAFADSENNKGLRFLHKPFLFLAPRDGLEPPT